MKAIHIIKQGTIVLAALLLTFSCNREVELSYNDFDLNGDQEVDRSEFIEVFTENYYDDWNDKDDDYLDDEDFYLAFYEAWDEDDDDMLTREEWIVGYDYQYGEYVMTDVDAIDTDADGFIEYVEFEEYFDDTDFFTAYDVDASEYLTEEELAEGVFEMVDIDNNNIIEEDEFLEFDTYFFDI